MYGTIHVNFSLCPQICTLLHAFYFGFMTFPIFSLALICELFFFAPTLLFGIGPWYSLRTLMVLCGGDQRQWRVAQY